ncbi:Cof-type HAD-IIB family hydrolase [Acinetobacter larvae]|uniref:Hydrolase n=1 Tax=Acinetobacter larvae TaxID=1789224 RepID=A0A1B2M0T6_9GAMM|nr:Cof-type HAD-IIB family hydrolase [Acinetobacter larvae]AOA58785.1 hydrolase [Acinetobacter larvae]
MSVKLIAVDMDSTFLRTDKSYDKTRFLQQYAALKQRGIYFVAASGNPLYTLQYYFPEIADEIAYVAENGVYVVDGQQELNFSHFDSELLRLILNDLYPDFAACMVLCGKQQALISTAVAEQSLAKLSIYYKNLQRCEDVLALQQPICKITLNTKAEHEAAVLAQLAEKSYVQQHLVHVVSSGFGFIDLILPNKHKAYGLRFLQQKWAIDSANVLAIGDNYNDLQMVQQAGYGFAMDNAVDALKQVAKYHAPSNDEDGVLAVIDWVLAAAKPWPLATTAESY